MVRARYFAIGEMAGSSFGELPALRIVRRLLGEVDFGFFRFHVGPSEFECSHGLRNLREIEGRCVLHVVAVLVTLLNADGADRAGAVVGFDVVGEYRRGDESDAEDLFRFSL